MEKLLTEQEAESFLGMAPGFLRKNRYMGRPHPPFIKVGTAIRYRPSDIEQFIEERTSTRNNDLGVDSNFKKLQSGGNHYESTLIKHEVAEFLKIGIRLVMFTIRTIFWIVSITGWY